MRDGAHRPAEMLIDHIGGNAQFLGNLPLRHGMDAVQQKHLTLTRGQRFDDGQQG